MADFGRSAQDSGDEQERPEGPADRLLEEIRIRFFEGGKGGLLAGDPRTQTIYECLAERLLQDEPGDADVREAGRVEPLGRSSLITRQFRAYVRQSLASIERRAHLVDHQGQPRVIRAYRSQGLIHQIDLADWRGKRRARVLFDNAGEAVEVRLTSSSGPEVSYTVQSFDLANGVAGKGPQTSSVLADCLERARSSAIRVTRDSSIRHQKMMQLSVEALCKEVFPRLEKLLELELVQGRQLVPCSEDLLEMGLEQIFEQLEQPGSTADG
mmetsp:Transcript_36504/g.58868  ORF Transcript_36504/g.58868 Transcript_36504/m.58868 type:complete len:269 (+) Transcript_36504:116-922(+)